MAYSDPWDAVIAELTAPAAKRPTPTAPPGDPRPVPVISRGHPFSARPETLRAVKERSIPHRRLYMVTFEDQASGMPWRWLIGAEEDDGEWMARGGAGEGGDGPTRDHPWVNLAGWWGAGRFSAGGEVLSEQHIEQVRLTARDGTTLHDDTEAGVVLFLTDHELELPVTLELLDNRGHILASQLELDLPG
jgi:hypothetical protein